MNPSAPCADPPSPLKRAELFHPGEDRPVIFLRIKWGQVPTSDILSMLYCFPMENTSQSSVPRSSSKPVWITIVVLAVLLLGWYATKPAKAPSMPGENMPVTKETADGYTLDPARTRAEFQLDEVLRGKRVTVVGVTSDVEADFTFD